jgi:gamma-glutamyltranspeptidase/glutathione hydrolase
MAPAIHLASAGFILTDEEASELHADNLTPFAASRRIFQRDGNFYKTGDTFRQPQLARSLQRIAANPDDFYRGRMARQLIADLQKGGALLTLKDLADYNVIERAPVTGTFHNYTILSAPPPSSGGIVLISALNILEGYDLYKLGDRTPQSLHLITEAWRRAFMDRADYLGDPDFTPQPIRQMTNPRYARAWRRTISRTKPTPSKDLRRPAGFMPPPPAPGRPVHESMQTTHFSIVDAEGNAVANTFTLNNTFGSGVTVAGLGFLLNDEMDDFAAKQGVPNMYGLIQGPANSIAPFKRPLSAMTPTIVTRNGKLRYVLGSPGGSTIITTVANDIISVIDNHLNIQRAADAPRFHHQYLPDRIDVEKKFPLKVVDQLRAMGYTVRRDAVADEHNPGTWGDSELIAVDAKTGELLGGHDGRHDYGKAAGY